MSAVTSVLFTKEVAAKCIIGSCAICRVTTTTAPQFLQLEGGATVTTQFKGAVL